ncbi:hypothetical protein CHELA41_24516 [Hyphomicrobiales bacterium]|nr:hypothetical protein CHELA41_24516 [Hyphomicrobiales bacterium]
MPLAKAIDLCPLGNVSGRLLAVLGAKGWRQIAFPVFAAVAQRNDMVEVVSVSRSDLMAGEVALAAAAFPYPELDARRYCCVG